MSAWRALAACRGMDQAIFFPEEGGVGRILAQEAKAVCGECPVQKECLDDALEQGEHWGIRAGINMGKRKRLKIGVCKVCGVKFLRKGQRDSYCSEEHYKQARYAQQLEYLRRKRAS